MGLPLMERTRMISMKYTSAFQYLVFHKKYMATVPKKDSRLTIMFTAELQYSVFLEPDAPLAPIQSSRLTIMIIVVIRCSVFLSICCVCILNLHGGPWFRGQYS